MIYGLLIIIILVIALCFLRPKDTTMTIIYPDGTWFIGVRKSKFISRETKGTHHFIVINGTSEFDTLKGYRLAVPINQAKYFIISNKENK
jgi:hypothetical protein